VPAGTFSAPTTIPSASTLVTRELVKTSHLNSASAVAL
jgi:hypothetical protein